MRARRRELAVFCQERCVVFWVPAFLPGNALRVIPARDTDSLTNCRRSRISSRRCASGTRLETGMSGGMNHRELQKTGVEYY
jgi:hypothetical protein